MLHNLIYEPCKNHRRTKHIQTILCMLLYVGSNYDFKFFFFFALILYNISFDQNSRLFKLFYSYNWNDFPYFFFLWLSLSKNKIPVHFVNIIYDSGNHTTSYAVKCHTNLYRIKKIWSFMCHCKYLCEIVHMDNATCNQIETFIITINNFNIVSVWKKKKIKNKIKTNF